MPELEFDLGSYQGRPYLLRIRGNPSLQHPDEFAVVLRYKTSVSDDSTVIARVDTAHGYTHFDKLYREDEPKDPVDWELWDAVEHLTDNWLQYARTHAQK
jgi:hypothetical protein